jgi:riboflavin kinase/FMN adenylyltransferase
MPETLRIFRDWRDLPAEARGASVALGNFDGVHLGHAHMLRTAHSARPDAPSAVLTFEPHPREHFRPDDPPFRLTLSAERAAALAALGVEFLYELPFDAAFSLMTAEAFVADVLHAGLGARHLVTGPDFAFGHRRGGDISFLAARAETLGIGITTATVLSDEGGPISSTRIRRALQDGYPQRATALLGRPWAIVGPVTHGDKRGRTIGFPTANLGEVEQLLPPRGVYACRARIAAHLTKYKAVMNLGARPTFTSNGIDSLEVHILDFDADLYGQKLWVSDFHWLRNEQAFPGMDALKAQIQEDVARARAVL